MTRAAADRFRGGPARRALFPFFLGLLLALGPTWAGHGQTSPSTPPATGDSQPPDAASPHVESAADVSPGPHLETPILGTVRQALARETRRVQEHMAALAAFEAELTREERLEEESTRTAQALVAALSAELSVATTASRQITDLYYRILEQLRRELEGLRARLEGWGERSQVPTFLPGLSLEPLDIPQLQAPLRALRELLERARGETEELRREELDLRMRSLEQEADRVRSLNRLRIVAIRRMKFGGWANTLATPRETLASTLEIFDQYGLLGRYELLRRWQSVRKLATVSGVLTALGSVSYALVEGFLVVVFLRWLLGRVRRGAGDSSKRQEEWWADRPRGSQTWFALAATLAPWSLFLVGVWAIGRILGEKVHWAELEFLLLAAGLYGAYRLALDTFSGVVVFGTSILRSLRMSRQRQAEVVGSVRTLLRAGFLLAVILLPVNWVTGGSLLYDLFLGTFGLVFCGLALLTLERWRAPILDTYCSIGWAGRLPDWICSNRYGWRAWVAAPVAFASLAWAMALSLTEDAAFRFRSTRQLVTALSRKRLDGGEDSGGQVGVAPVPVPARLTERLLAEGEREDLFVPRGATQQALSEALSAWRTGESRGAFLLTGEQGVGKRCWLRGVSLGNEEVARASLDRRVTDPAELAEFLGPKITGETATAWDLDLLRQALLRGPPRIVVLDTCEHLFLSCVGGYRGLDAFQDLVEATGGRVFWLCSVLEAAWAHLRAMRGPGGAFRWHENLTPWTEEEIQELIRKRTALSGVRVIYDPLRLGRPETRPFRFGSGRPEEDYLRVLWDRAMGNPSTALSLFLRSLVPCSPSEVRVGLFPEPQVEDLDLGQETAPLLAALTTHGTLTVEESAAVLHLPQALCTIAIGRLEDLGVLRGDAGRYRIDPCWHPTVKRSLKRKNLLSA